MQTPSRRSVEKIRSKDRVKTDLQISSRKIDDEKVKKAVTTPRNYVQNTTTADIYGKKKVDVMQAPKKSFSKHLNTAKNVSPMKEYLKSTPSTVSVRKTPIKMAAEKKNELKDNINSARKTTPRVKAQTPANVTVNSPVLRRSNVDLKKDKSNLSIDRPKISDTFKADDGKSNMADIFLRQRSKTRTLDENEVKMLKADVVDNNIEMQNLSRKLTAKPKAFYVDLNGEVAKIEKEKSSEEEFDYEDDFERYESDFDSYHSETQSDANSTSDEGQTRDGGTQSDVSLERKDERNTKENEEKMLDSGSFELRDPQRSAQKLKTPLDFIQEAVEDDKRISLTDEGFQDMSSSSIVSSTKTVHVDVLDRPLFIDFAVSKRNRKKRRVFEQLQQRANDILSMVTLHEMTYSLFEMQPIPYDLYMATFGRSNTTQVAVQTFDDGVTEEVQTDDIVYKTKWTQHPIEFSKHNIHVREKVIAKNKNDFLDRLLLHEDNKEKYDKAAYTGNPLRIYLEQKNGVGNDEILPHDIYKSELKQSDFNMYRLKKFLKRTESRISNILSINTGNTDTFNLRKSNKFPFSTGYVTIPKNINGISFYSKIINVFFSINKSNLIVTVHDKYKDLKCFLCLWDLSGGMAEPIKVLVASDNVTVGQYRGGVDGIIVAALEDGSIHLWDLSERATWTHDVASDEKPTNSVEIDNSRLTQTELDREWNLNSRSEKRVLRPMQISAYTSSGVNIIERDVNDSVVALEFVGESSTSGRDDKRKVIAQICSLQRIGILTIWSIVLETSSRKFSDIGKAFWSKMALEKVQTIHLAEYLDVQLNDQIENINKNFNLNAAKRRMCIKRRETNLTTNSSGQSSDRSRSAASAGNRKVPTQKNNTNIWETGIVCNDMKIIRLNNSEYFLIAKNCGEVLRCIRYTGTFKVNRFCVASDTSSITRLELSQNGLPLVLAGTESGTINLCSIVDFKVLLTLDCSNVNSITSEKYKTDSKGRYVSSVQTDTRNNDQIRKERKMTIKSLVWPRSNPLDMVASLVDRTVSVWRLTTSDIAARRVDIEASITVCSGDTMALVTSQNEVQVYRISSEKHPDNLHLFKRYLALL